MVLGVSSASSHMAEPPESPTSITWEPRAKREATAQPSRVRKGGDEGAPYAEGKPRGPPHEARVTLTPMSQPPIITQPHCSKGRSW